MLELVHHAQALQVVLEAAVLRHAGIERVLARVAERRVAEVVRQGDRFHQVLVEPQRARDRAAELRDLQRMREPRAEQVAFVVQEDLGLVDQPPERGGMHDAVAIALERVARRRRRFRMAPAARSRRVAGVGRLAHRLQGSRSLTQAAQHCASTSRTIASGALRTSGRAGLVDHDEADLAGLRLLVDAHQFEVALGAERRSDHRQPGAFDQRASADARSCVDASRVAATDARP